MNALSRISLNYPFYLTGKCRRIRIRGKYLTLILFFFISVRIEVRAQATLTDYAEAPLVLFDEIPVRLMIEGYKMFYIDAMYGNNKQLFINVEDLFNTLDIQCVSSNDKNILEGFIESESQLYVIDNNTGQIKAGNKIIRTKNGITKANGSLYMESSLFAEAFGITLTFNYRALTIMLKSNFELPVLKQLRIEKLRKNVMKVKDEVIADTIVRRNYHLFKAGSADYSFGSYQDWEGHTNNQVSLGLGAELLYGEVNVAANYYSQYQFGERNLNYLWRWVDNDKKFLRQAQFGKITNESISFLDAPVVGGSLGNTPTTIRKATGYYLITDRTEPDWNVELYINSVLVDFTKADASGLYQFKVPIVYGYTTLKLKFYGPLGEERTDERTINVPYSVMPKGELEYGLSGGILENQQSDRFGRVAFNYGLARRLTIGGGIEYLSSIAKNPIIPFATLTFQPLPRMTMNAEYAHGVKTRALVNYYIRKDILIEIDYTKFVEGQMATRFNAPEERKIKLSFPVKIGKIIGFTRTDYTQLVYKSFTYNYYNAVISLYYNQFNINSGTILNWTNSEKANVISDLALSYRLKNGFTIRPSAQYNFHKGNLNTLKIALEKYFTHGNIAISYEKNLLFNDHYININLRYDLPGARTNLSVSRSRDTKMTSENIQGSLAFGGGNGYVYSGNNSSVSKGGLLIYPYLDINNNGIFDKGEPMVKITSVGIMGGKAIYNDKDLIIRIPDLNAFTSYFIEFRDTDLGNISWRFRRKTYQVLIDPNQFKRIDVPVNVVGEVSGMTYLEKDDKLKGLCRVLVRFYRMKGNTGIKARDVETQSKDLRNCVAEVLSESDGYFYYMGLPPGEYTVKADPDQLRNLKMICSPEEIRINVRQSQDGDVVDGLNFILRPVREPDSGK